MRSSARNQIEATITGLRPGPTFDEVVLTARSSGHQLVAAVMAGSSERMGLRLRSVVTVLVNASSMMLIADGQSRVYSPRNQFIGTVTGLTAGAFKTEIVVSVPPRPGDEHDGQPLTLVATSNNASVEALGLQMGAPVTALFHASAVVLAAPRPGSY